MMVEIPFGSHEAATHTQNISDRYMGLIIHRRHNRLLLWDQDLKSKTFRSPPRNLILHRDSRSRRVWKEGGKLTWGMELKTGSRRGWDHGVSKRLRYHIVMDGSRWLCPCVPKSLGVGLKYGPKQWQVGEVQFILLELGIPSNYKTMHKF